MSINEAASVMGRRSAKARRLTLGKEAFRERMQQLGRRGGKAKAANTRSKGAKA